jgi:hypothetical protein
VHSIGFLNSKLICKPYWGRPSALPPRSSRDLLDWRKTIHQFANDCSTLRPMGYYRGGPAALHEARRRKMAEARHRRRGKNLKLRQPTLPIESTESVANERPGMSHCG